MNGREDDDAGLVVLPTPCTAPSYDGWFAMPLQGAIAVASPSASIYARQIADDLGAYGATGWKVVASGGFVTLSIECGLTAGAYRIVCSPETEVRITGGGSEGLRNGVQTFRQILSQTWPMLPRMRMEDEPRFRVRGYMLDVTRERVPTMAWLRHWVDKLCYYKYNQFQLYFEHTFAYDGMSQVWDGADPITPDQLKELDAYCAARDIELVPAVASFGHQYMALRTTKLRTLGELPEDADRPFSFIERQQHHTFNAGDPRAFATACAMVDDVCAPVNSVQCNIGGDETFDLGRGRSRALARRIGRDELYARWMNAMVAHVRRRDGRVQMWADIALSMPGVMARLPQDVVMLNWDYAPHVNEANVKAIADTGLPQLVCPAVHAWNELIPRVNDAWSNISEMARLGAIHGARGMLVTDWGDFGHINDPRMALPGMIFGSTCAWSPTSDRQETFEAASRLEYGDAHGAIVERMGKVAEQDAWRWEDMVRYLELDDGSGNVNHEVLNTIEGLRDISGAGAALGEARCAYVRMRLANRMPGVIGELKRSLDDLGCALAHAGSRGGTDTSFDDMVNVRLPLALAMEGTLLLNEIGALLASQYVHVDVGDIDARKVADAWSEWSQTYARVWMTVSRRSELWRLQRLFGQVERLLRTMPQ